MSSLVIERFVRWGIATALVFAVSFAHAEPSAADKETARNLVYEGRNLRKQGKTREALEKFRSAHAIMNVPTTGIEVAQALVDLGLLVEARDAMLDLTRRPEAPGEPLPFGQAREEARRAVDELGARIPSATFAVSGAASPTVVVDGTQIDRSVLTLPRKLNPGQHVVVANAPGYVQQRVQFTLAEGESKTVAIAFVSQGREASKPAPAADQRPPPSPRHLSAVVYAGFGTAIVGTAVGGVAGVLSILKTSSVKGQCSDNQCPRALHDDLTSARRMATISDVAFGVAVAGAAVGVIGLAIPPKTPRATAQVFVGPGAVRIAGTF